MRGRRRESRSAAMRGFIATVTALLILGGCGGSAEDPAASVRTAIDQAGISAIGRIDLEPETVRIHHEQDGQAMVTSRSGGFTVISVGGELKVQMQVAEDVNAEVPFWSEPIS